MVAYINNLRTQNGLPPLRESCILDSSAQYKAEDFNRNRYFAHTSPSGETAEILKQRFGYPANSPGWGENILWSGSSVEDAFNIWVDSPDHLANMLGQYYTEVGVGISSGTPYWGVYVLHFGSASSTSCGGTVPPSSTDSARTTTSVNLRSAPSIQGAVLRVLPTNTIVTLVGGYRTADGYTWANVSVLGITGWVASNYVTGLPTSTVPTPTIRPTPVPTRTPTQSPPTSTSTKTTTTVNFRSAPSLSGSVLRVLPINTVVNYLGPTRAADGYTWANVSVSGQTGWIAVNYLQGNPTPMPTKKSTITPTPMPTWTPTYTPTPIPTYTPSQQFDIYTNDFLNVRVDPSTSAAILGTLPPQTGVVLAGGRVETDREWVYIQAGGLQGWVAAEFLDGYVSVPIGEEPEVIEEELIAEPIQEEITPTETQIPEEDTDIGTPTSE